MRQVPDWACWRASGAEPAMHEAAQPATLIELQHASVRFGSGAAATPALADVSLRVQAGERIALVGANGAGKSTLLRALHGVLPLSQGRRHCAPVRCAMVFQRPFMLRMSVQANLALALWLAGVPRRERAGRIGAALAQVGLGDLRERNARALSVGQQQRVALARAWALHPRVLLLDEPTASLDPGAKREVEALIQRFADAGVTLLMSSHNLGQVKRLASRVVYLHHGRIGADVPVHDFFHRPMPADAAQFLRGELP
jgi:tungstate transport system ATP-binding protein